MNNEFYQNNGIYRNCYQNNKCCNDTYINNCQNTNCCPQIKPLPCCPTTVTVGTTTTGAPGTQASVSNVGTPNNAILNFVIPAGEPGAANISVGTTTTLPAGSQATVTNSGTSENVILNFGIPAGQSGTNGQDGRAATITIGSTTTGAPGTNATVTNSGTTTDAVLNFVIPRGATGATGPAGPAGTDGSDGVDGTAATITIGSTTTAEPGTPASVTNVGTENAAILNFVIPAGEPGTITPGVSIPLLDATATLADVITTVNNLITSLTNAGFLA